jgi:hypothetical protein
MNSLAEGFYECGESYAGGFFEFPEKNRFFRHANAIKKYWTDAPLPAYQGGALYPCGVKPGAGYAVFPEYSYTFGVDFGLLKKKFPEGEATLRAEKELLSTESTPHTVGGWGYTHSIPNYGRIEREGLSSYAKRVSKLPDGDFKDGLFEVLSGIEIYRYRSLSLLREAGAPEALISALSRVPFEPARDLYEAVVCRNFIYYIDGCDNPGRLDADLIDFYRGGDFTPLFREFFKNVDDNNGWSSALGPDYNPLTIQCLNAIHGLRRPSLELRVTPDMPDAVWDAAIDALKTGCGQPALYNEDGFQKAMSFYFPAIPEADLKRFNGGGCTETMLAGISNVGSLDAGINLPLIFSAYLRENLGACTDFTRFYNGLLLEIKNETVKTLRILNDFRRRRAEFLPQPVRTLLIDDCVDNGLDFNAGGARYYWSVINFAGLVNVIDSLLVVRELVFDRKEYAAPDFLSALDANEPVFRAKAAKCPSFGNDDDRADPLAADFAARVFETLESETPYLGGRFLPSSIQFVTYVNAGRDVPATPDGRKSGDPLADSVGAIAGKDKSGPTALLNSVSKLPLGLAAGTPVLNLKLQKRFLDDNLRKLITVFFSRGGMQAQITCTSRAEIEEAIAHPEKHENLIVRIGGYAEYFNRLSPELKKTVLDRTEY